MQLQCGRHVLQPERCLCLVYLSPARSFNGDSSSCPEVDNRTAPSNHPHSLASLRHVGKWMVMQSSDSMCQERQKEWFVTQPEFNFLQLQRLHVEVLFLCQPPHLMHVSISFQLLVSLVKPFELLKYWSQSQPSDKAGCGTTSEGDLGLMEQVQSSWLIHTCSLNH